MSRKLLIALTVVLLSVIFFAGCGPEQKTEPKKPIAPDEKTEVKEDMPEAKIALEFKPGDVSSYKIAFETIQSVKLDMVQKQPIEDQSNTRYVEVAYTQEIQSVKDSVALAKITLMDIKIIEKKSDQVTYSFDSRDEKDSKRPLNALIGESYTINISSDGSVTPEDVKEIRAVKITGAERKTAVNLLSDPEIIKRHERPLPSKDEPVIKVGSGWSEIVWSHPKIMAVKSFEKSYVLKDIEGDVANIDMSAYETDKAAEGQTPAGSGFGFMAKMFDSQEKFTGKMQFNLDSNRVVKWNEKCVATYVVTDKTSKSKQGGPATLKMGLTHSVDLEKID